MTLGITKYILRFGSDTGKDMLVKFRNDETLRENMARIIPHAIRQELLPDSCSADHVEIDHKDRTLNLNLPIREQNLREYDVLMLRDLSCSVKITMRFKPDKSEPAVQSVTVEPTVVLKEALKEFTSALSKKHKFYGRKVKRYNLLLKDKKLDLDRSLRAQGIKNDIEVKLKPRVRFEWPPGFFWPPGPYTTYLMVGIIIGLVVGGIFLYRHLWHDEVRVTLKSQWPSKFYDWNGDFLGDRESETRLLKVGKPYKFTVYPRGRPYFDTTVHFERRLREDVLTLQIDPKSKFKDRPLVQVNIQGFYEHLGEMSRVDSTEVVLINRHEYETNNWGEVEKAELVLGRYEIEYALAGFRLKRVVFCGDTLDSAGLLFDLNTNAFIQSAAKYIEFTYEPQR